MLASSTTIN